MKAIFVTGGKQYYVTEGDVIYVEKLDVEAGKDVEFTDVLMVGETVGTPNVKGAKVEGKVIAHGKGKKVLVYKYKAKKNYRRTQGHRQPYTKVEITKIKTASEKAEVKEEAPAKEVKATSAKPATKTTTKKAETTKKEA